MLLLLFEKADSDLTALLTTQILNLRDTKIGKISKHWSGLAREFFTDLDYFGIKFPMELDVNTKAMLLGALMLIVNILQTNLSIHSFEINSKLFFLFSGCHLLFKIKFNSSVTSANIV